ncbi:hypothetical protein ACH5RR_015025 [Cinchona calisaya]|uniref:DUF4408 domain-containing protein n=1 Tax=Cinchona calisaya TaxID=153742 RepID=A0ABD2ZTN8_9GENT
MSLLLSIMKIILILIGAISIIFTAIKFSAPSFVALHRWLKPPYLYFILNGIIITIAASSRFNHRQGSKTAAYRSHEENRLISARTTPPLEVVPAVVLVADQRQPAELYMNAVDAPPAVVEVYGAEADNVVELKPVVVNGVQQFDEGDDDDDVTGGDWMISECNYSPPAQRIIASPEILQPATNFEEAADDDVAGKYWMISESNYNPQSQTIGPPETLQLDFHLPPKEKPLLSFGFDHQKPIKTTPEDERGAKVARPKTETHETFESTWKMITEGRHVPHTQFKRSDTWKNHGREVVVNSLDHQLARQPALKSETFKDRTNYHELSPIQSKIKKEPSLSQDELNRRVEDFINKVNEDMRLQRQESMKKYLEMINRGAY